MGKADLIRERPVMRRHRSIADREWPEGQLFYIQDGRQVIGNCLAWWRVDGKGYSSDLKQAWKVPYDKAFQIERNRESEIIWPCDQIDAISQVHVDIQNLRPIQERERPTAPDYPNLKDSL